MKRTAIGLASGLMLATAASFSAQAQTPAPVQTLATVPGQSTTVTDWYKQNVYDGSNNKVGEIMDVLVTPDGKVSALIVGVGGFLSLGEKDVAVPFAAVKHTLRDGKVYLTLDATKDSLKSAAGFKYDRTTTTWVPDTSSSSSGSSTGTTGR